MNKKTPPIQIPPGESQLGAESPDPLPEPASDTLDLVTLASSPPPAGANPEDGAPYFKKLAELAVGTGVYVKQSPLWAKLRAWALGQATEEELIGELQDVRQNGGQKLAELIQELEQGLYDREPTAP